MKGLEEGGLKRQGPWRVSGRGVGLKKGECSTVMEGTCLIYRGKIRFARHPNRSPNLKKKKTKKQGVKGRHETERWPGEQRGQKQQCITF